MNKRDDGWRWERTHDTTIFGNQEKSRDVIDVWMANAMKRETCFVCAKCDRVRYHRLLLYVIHLFVWHRARAKAEDRDKSKASHIPNENRDVIS